MGVAEKVGVGASSGGVSGGAVSNIFDIFTAGEAPSAGIRASYPGTDESWTARGFQIVASTNASVLLPLSSDAASGWKFTLGTIAAGASGNRWTLRTIQRRLAASAKAATYAWHYRTDGGTRRYINVTADAVGPAGNSRRFNVIARGSAGDQYLQNGNDYDIRIRTNGTMPAHEFLTAANAAFSGITFSAGTDYAFSGGITLTTTAANYQNLAGGANAVAAGTIGFSTNLNQRRITLIYDKADTLAAIRAAIATTIAALTQYATIAVQGTVVEATDTFGVAGGADLNFAGGVNGGRVRVEADKASKFIDIHYNATGTLTSIFTALEAARASPSYRGSAVGTGTPEAVGWVRSVGPITAEANTSSSSSGTQLTNPQIKTKYEANPNTNAFTDALETKLSGIEAAATKDQTGAQIKVAYEGEADTNAFTDALKAKLASLSSGRSVGSGVINLGVVTVGVDRLSVPAPTGYSSRYPNGTALAFSTPNPLGRTTNSISFYIGNDNYEFYGAGTGSIYFSTLETETIYYALVFGGYIQIIGPQRVKADQTGAQIKVAYEGEADTNAFTDALKTKLEGVATAATAVSIANVLAKIFAGTGINVNKAVAGQITISATGGSGGTADGVVRTAVFDETSQVVTLTTSLGGTVTVDLSSFITAAELATDLAKIIAKFNEYVKVDGTTAFTGPVSGVSPVKGTDFVTLAYFNTHRNVSPIADDVYFGVSDDGVAIGTELTVAGVNGVGTIAAYVGSKHQLIARLATEVDITTVFYSDDPTNENAIGVFTKQVAKVTPTGEPAGTLFNVWVSDQALINRADVILTVA